MAPATARLRERPAARRTSERERLATAILDASKARAAVQGNERATSRAYDMVLTCSGRLERAAIAIKKARSRDTESAAAAAKRGAATAPASVMAKARAAEQSAQDELTAARAAHGKLADAQSGFASALAIAQMAVERLVDETIVSELDVKRLVKETEQLTLQLARKRYLLERLAGFAGQSPVDLMIADEGLRERVRAVAYVNVDDAAHSGTAEAAWRELRERLAADADAPVALQ